MRRILITGGAGFIGTNATAYFLKKNNQVTIFDNFSREGSKKNIIFLRKNFKKNFKIVKGDVRIFNKKLINLINASDVVIHLAGQVAVTTSVIDPITDFDINVRGTINILEAIRLVKKKPILIYSSTNKVYGDLSNYEIVESEERYRFKNLPNGVSEQTNLDFYSPYGCSKGSADQYVHDYARIYRLNTIVFRQSCIYGPHQFGIEDQGWLAWFMIAVVKKLPITIYGNGKQVRDALFVDDLIRAYDLAIKNIKKTKGQVYNIGGGSKNTISVWKEFCPKLNELFNTNVKFKYSKQRPGDQPIYISDIRKAYKDFYWKPQVTLNDGLKQLAQWISNNKESF